MVPSGGASSSHLSAQQQADTVDVEGHNGKRHHAGKAIGAQGTDPIETPMLQIVDRRFSRRVLTAHGDKHRVLFAFPVDLRQAPLSRQHVVIQKLVENEPVLGTVEAAVEAAPAKLGEARLGLPDHRLGMVAALPHDLVVQDEALDVLQHADRNPEFHRRAGLALRDPPRMGLEDREHLLVIKGSSRP